MHVLVTDRESEQVLTHLVAKQRPRDTRIERIQRLLGDKRKKHAKEDA